MSVEKISDDKATSFWRSWRFIFGMFLSLAALLWLVITTDWPGVWQALENADFRLIIFAASLNVLTIPMRSGRWWLMFPKSSGIPLLKLTAVMLVGQAINVFLPGRIGELVQASLVVEEHVIFVFGTQLWRIVLDTMMLGIVVFSLLFRFSLPIWWREPAEVLLILTLLIFVGLAALMLGRHAILRAISRFNYRFLGARWRVFFEGVKAFFSSLDSVANPRLLLVLVACSILIWFLYWLTNYVLLAAVGITPSWSMALFILAVLLLGIAVPSSPGRVGVYHFLVVQALAAFNVANSEALSFAILSHLITIILPASLGVFLAWRYGISLRSQ